MKIAIMQPYIFPYIGYWQLINAADKFVILDDVNYIMRGYINRNSILLNGKPYRFTIPIQKASQNKLIKDTKLNFDQSARNDFLKTIKGAYKKAFYYEEVMPLIEDIVNNQEADLTEFVWNSIKKISEFLCINSEILISSKLNKDQALKGEARIIEICKRLDADIYINPCGGRKLYQHSHFKREGMQLFFLDTNSEKIVYSQNQGVFIKNLSIIDVLMNNDATTVRRFLSEYTLND